MKRKKQLLVSWVVALALILNFFLFSENNYAKASEAKPIPTTTAMAEAPSETQGVVDETGASESNEREQSEQVPVTLDAEQTHQETELVASDDGSNDSTEQVATTEPNVSSEPSEVADPVIETEETNTPTTTEQTSDDTKEIIGEKREREVTIDAQYGVDGLINYIAAGSVIYLSSTNSPSIQMTGLRSTMRGNQPPIIGQDHPTQPGQVMLYKEAHPVPGKVNMWDVTVRVEAKDGGRTDDIVLALDRSGSMQGDRLANTKAAATQFVDEILEDGNPHIRIALVTFATDVVVHTGFLNYTEKNTLIGQINAMTANGGTFTQGAVREAKSLLDTQSKADVKQIVLLSDGEPTFGYGLADENDLSKTSMQEINDYATSYDDPSGQQHMVNGSRPVTTAMMTPADFSTEVTGLGRRMFHRYMYDAMNGDRYYNLGNFAIAEAGYAKTAGYTLHTIAMEAGALGTPVLEFMASPGKSHTTNDSSQLSQIFSEIVAEIPTGVSDGLVDDPMGQGFRVMGTVTDIQKSQGDVLLTENGTKINWDLGPRGNAIDEDPSIKYAWMKYRVEITDDILNVQSEDGLYPTNDETTIKYKDALGETKTGVFPQPTVDPFFLTIEKKLLDADGQEIANNDLIFDVRVTGEQGYSRTFSLKSGKQIIATDIRDVEAYTAVETAVSSPASLKDYNISVAVTDSNGTLANPFTVNQGDPDKTVLVTNQELKAGNGTYTVDKAAAEKYFVKTGDAINYTVKIANTGEKAIANLKIKDTLVPFANMALVESKTADKILEVGETWTLTYTYAVTEADVTAGQVLNVVTVTDPQDPVNPKKDEVEVPYEPTPKKTEGTTKPITPPMPKTGETAGPVGLAILLLICAAGMWQIRRKYGEKNKQIEK